MIQSPVQCEKECNCQLKVHRTEFVVLTGGPGAGKTAVLEMLKKILCKHVAILPEAASILFGGGFWRLQSPTSVAAAQKAIFHVQREMEDLVFHEHQWALGLCDRGTLDGIAYWPEETANFWASLKTTQAQELARYKAVIHLRTPTEKTGYNFQNPLRIETAAQARLIDEKIHLIWKDHPKYRQIEATSNFLEKAQMAIRYLGEELPECCREALLSSKSF